MKNMAGELENVIRRILRDIQVELSDEFDKNFERQGFFTTAWQRRKSPLRGDGHILVDTGTLRRSVKSVVSADSITFESTLPYAAIHNEGGTIKVTANMKRFFWAKYYETTGRFGRRKDGTLRQDKRTLHLSTEAEFWKAMALMKVGQNIEIPRRQFLGYSPEVEKLVQSVVEDNLQTYFKSIGTKLKNES